MRNPLDTVARWLMVYAFPGDYIQHEKMADPRRQEIERWYLEQVQAIRRKYAQMHDAQVFAENGELDAVYQEFSRRVKELEES